MRVKLDENLPVQLKRLFAESGHDAATVVDEGLGGASDTEVAAVCIGEERVLVTQDLDFCDIRTYPPVEYFGIVVFRLSTGARDALLEVGAILDAAVVHGVVGRGRCSPVGHGVPRGPRSRCP